MGDLTANLSRSEFDCPCDLPACSRTPVDYVLVDTIQDAAYHFLSTYSSQPVSRIAVNINSGLRCLAYDAEMKGKTPADFNGIKVSEHVWGIAADFWFEIVFSDGTRERIDDALVVAFLEDRFPDSCGIGQYDGRTHFDTRPEKARWDNRTK
jgi:hypothetical protein